VLTPLPIGNPRIIIAVISIEKRKEYENEKGHFSTDGGWVGQ
jgi:hypothetical protein